MSRSQLKNSLRERKLLFGGWISYDHPAIAETFALTGFDFISIDMEHAPISIASAQRIISITQSKQIPCLPRPVSHSNDYFKPLLDSGADGLIVQMVNNTDEIEKISNSLKYPPLGKRTFGINRAQDYGLNFKTYVENWNAESILIAQIESKKGIENIDSIVSHPNVDGIMIGPYDLSGSYGVPGETNNRLVLDACSKVISTCKKYQKSCGTQLAATNIKNVEEAIALGYTFLILSSDLFILSNWSKEITKMMKKYK